MSKEFFEVTLSRTLGNVPLENRTSNMFIVVLLSEKGYMFPLKSFLNLVV